MSFLGAVIDGVLLGGYYAMVACGLSFMFGIMKIINLAHGSLAILGAFMLWMIAENLGYDPFLALFVVLPAMACLGWLLQRAVLERLFEAELDHLHELEEKYHAHLDRSVVELSRDEDKLLANWLFRGIHVGEDAGVVELYTAALEMEKRTRDHFRKLVTGLPAGLERDLCAELAAEEEEHVALLEGELEQLG